MSFTCLQPPHPQGSHGCPAWSSQVTKNVGCASTQWPESAINQVREAQSLEGNQVAVLPTNIRKREWCKSLVGAWFSIYWSLMFGNTSTLHHSWGFSSAVNKIRLSAALVLSWKSPVFHLERGNRAPCSLIQMSRWSGPFFIIHFRLVSHLVSLESVQ